MSFLNNIKRAPESGGGGSYVKLMQGKNTFRIVGHVDDNGFINGMLGWANNEDGGRKPYRWKVGEEAPRNFEDKPKEFFAMKVYNYAEERVQVLEITQKILKDTLSSYCHDADWGDPRGYDIDIIKNGEGLETSYAMVAKPHKKMTDEQRQVCIDTKVDLHALYQSGDPFAVSEQPKPKPEPEPQPEPEPAPEPETATEPETNDPNVPF